MLAVAAALAVFSWLGVSRAEQSGSSPVSGATSRIKTIYDVLSGLSYGSDTPGAWGNWGAYWNRIYSAGEWTPSGAASAAAVGSGSTFYSNSRSQQTGTYPTLSGCSTQLYFDSWSTATPANNCSLTWTVPGGATGSDKQDPRTGLIWSYLLYRNGTVIEFSATLSTTFSWGNTHANNKGITAPVAGDRTAIQLCADQVNGWRLPTQKELIQAYIDGSFWNLTQPSHTFWSATEESLTDAWYVDLGSGYSNTANNTKTSPYSVRCVR